MKLYGIWCFDKQDWFRELESKVAYGGIAILSFERKKDAFKRAAENYGYLTYTEAKRDGWCEVRELS